MFVLQEQVSEKMTAELEISARGGWPRELAADCCPLLRAGRDQGELCLSMS